MQRDVWKVRGMTCEHCARAVREALLEVDGVIDAEVNLAGEEATVTYEPGKVRLDALRAAVEEAGYELVTG